LVTLWVLTRALCCEVNRVCFSSMTTLALQCGLAVYISSLIIDLVFTVVLDDIEM